MFKKINRIYQLQNFKDIINLLEGLEYFPFYGTLLGLVRENNILEIYKLNKINTSSINKISDYLKEKYFKVSSKL